VPKLDPYTAESQSRLLTSLQAQMLLNTMPQPKIRDRSKPRPNLNRAGRGSFEDHKRLLRYYVCSCGATIGDKFTHSTVASQNGTALDKYASHCDSCGEDQEVSFVSLRSTLQEIQKEEKPKDRNLFPYF
jgi:hypothetical protein